MFKVGDKVTVAWDRLREVATELEFKHFKNLLIKELKRGDGTLEVFDVSTKNVAGVAGWSGSAILGLIHVPDYVLNHINPIQHNFEEVFLLDGLRLVAQENMAGEWYIYLLHDVLRSAFPVTTVASASTKEEAIVLLNQIASALGNYEFPRATTKAISDLRKYLKSIKKSLKVNPVETGQYGIFVYFKGTDEIERAEYSDDKKGAIELGKDLADTDLDNYYVEVWKRDKDGLFGVFGKPSYKSDARKKFNPIGGDANEDAARELVLYIENDGDLYRQSFLPIVYNLQKKIKKGTFDLEKSLTLWGFLADAGAKKYTKDLGSPGDKWNDLFNKSTRRLVAKELAESFMAEIEAGNFWEER